MNVTDKPTVSTSEFSFMQFFDEKIKESETFETSIHQQFQLLKSAFDELQQKDPTLPDTFGQLKKITSQSLELNHQWMTRMIDQARDDERKKLEERMQARKKSWENLYRIASVALQKNSSFVTKLKGANNEVKDSDLQQASEALQILENHLKGAKQVPATVESTPRAPHIQKPHIIPEAEELARNLQNLNNDLGVLMRDALDPSIKTNIEELKDKWQKMKTTFSNFEEDYKTLAQPIHSKLFVLQGKIKKDEAKAIPKEHFDSIAIFETVSYQKIAQKIGERKRINEQRRKMHDKLAYAWSLILIQREAIQWELTRIEIYTHVYTLVRTLSGCLSQLSGQIDILKHSLRDQEPKKRSVETELLKFLVTAKQTFGGCINTYKELAESGSKLQSSAEKVLKEILDQMEKGTKTLNDELAQISIYSKQIEESVANVFRFTRQQLQDERQQMHHVLDLEWKSVYQFLGLPSNQESLTYELLRLGYSIDENKGKIPTDTFYKVSIWGWNPKDYVHSPFAPPEPKIQNDTVVNSSPTPRLQNETVSEKKE